MRPTDPLLLKLLALPLARPTGTNPPKFLLHPLRSSLASASDSDRLSKPQQYVAKATDKAADLWSGLGKADGGWKKKAFDTGERLMDKIEYEEWALKAIDPALAPRPLSASLSSSSSSSSSPSPSRKPKPDETVEILFPPSLLDKASLLSSLREQLAHRAPHHRSAAIQCLVLSPLTWPFAILPIVPNFPLFYVLWRAWSHYRAAQASNYLLSLLPPTASSSPSDSDTPSSSSSAPERQEQHEQLRLLPSRELDSLYSTTTPSTTSEPQGEGELLLTPSLIPHLVRLFRLHDDERKELERAVWQSGERLRQVREGEDGEGEGVEREEARKVKEAVTEEAKKEK
ncbi:hypothetical protein JCM10213_007141 [Rhodosporidiobolus nylandii]